MAQFLMIWWSSLRFFWMGHLRDSQLSSLSGRIKHTFSSQTNLSSQLPELRHVLNCANYCRKISTFSAMCTLIASSSLWPLFCFITIWKGQMPHFGTRTLMWWMSQIFFVIGVLKKWRNLWTKSLRWMLNCTKVKLRQNGPRSSLFFKDMNQNFSLATPKSSFSVCITTHAPAVLDGRSQAPWWSLWPISWTICR